MPIREETFTTTPTYLEYIQKDPLRLTSATVRFFWQSHRLDRFIDRHIESNRQPVQLFLAGKDEIIDNVAVRKVLERGRHSELEVVDYEEQTHSLQLDAPERLAEDMSRWLKRRVERTRAISSARNDGNVAKKNP
jgi:esterase/lipase